MARACGKTVLDCLHSCNNQMNACLYIYVLPSPKTWGSRHIWIRIQWNVRPCSMECDFFFHLWVFMARDCLSIIATEIWSIFSSKKNICQALLLLYFPYCCVQNSSSVCQQVVVLVNIHTYFTSLQLRPEFEQERTVSPFCGSPLAVYCVGCGVGHRF